MANRTAFQHFPIIGMMFVALWLSIGTISVGNAGATAGMVIFALTALVVYVVLIGLDFGSKLSSPVEFVAEKLSLPADWQLVAIWTIGLAAVAFSLIHYAVFGGFTIPSIFRAKTTLDMAMLRQHVTEDLPKLVSYLRSFVLRCLFPIGLALAVTSKQRTLAIVIGIAGAVYAVCMLQKAGPILLTLPTLVLLLFTRRFIAFVGLAVATCLLVFAMGLAASPDIKPDPPKVAVVAPSVVVRPAAPAVRASPPSVQTRPMPATPTLSATPATARPTAAKPVAARPAPTLPSAPATVKGLAAALTIVRNLTDRLVLLPGVVVAEWYDVFPAKMPFGKGCGFRLTAAIQRCEFLDYSKLLYPLMFGYVAEMGVHGSLNAGSMMTAYANYGLLGIIGVGVLHGIIAWLLAIIFARNLAMSVAINIGYVFFLSSNDLFTLLFSGGWALAVLLFLLVGRPQPVLHTAQDRPIVGAQVAN